jgi:solute carrier family 38 (sodium-coupled neutral amino acid transporter), member 11
VPFAFSKIGVVTGLLTMAVVAYANELTSRLLTRAAAYSGKSSYEELAEWAGGYRWKVSALGNGCSSHRTDRHTRTHA